MIYTVDVVISKVVVIQMDPSKNCSSLQNLQEIVDSGAWKNNNDLIRNIYAHYKKIAQSQSADSGKTDYWNSLLKSQIASFGNSDFWRSVSNISSDRTDSNKQLGRGDNSVLKNKDTKNGAPAVTREQNENSDQQLSGADIGGSGNAVAELSEQVSNGIENQSDNTVDIVPSDFYILKSKYNKSSKSFGANYGRYDLFWTDKMKDTTDDVELILLSIFMDILETLKKDGDDRDLLSLFIDHPVLDIPIVIQLRPQVEMTPEIIVDYLCAVLQSKRELSFDDHMTIYFSRIRRPSGGSRLARKYVTNLEEYLTRKKAIIQMRNRDNICLARAIVTAKARLDHDHYSAVREGDRRGGKLQRRRAEKLMRDAGLAGHDEKCGPEEWKKLEAVLGYGQYQLKIFDKDTFNSLVHVGPDAPKVIHLWLYNNHFHVITSPAAFFEKSYWCEVCSRAYSKKTDHRICPVRCSSCFGFGKCALQRPMKKCDRCNRFFNNPTCFVNHLRKSQKGKQMSLCEQLRRCETCRYEFHTSQKHNCGIRECYTCKQEVYSAEHQCYIQPYEINTKDSDLDPLAEVQEIPDSEGETDAPMAKKRKLDKQEDSFIFYDFESRQDESIGQNENGDINIHCPNFCVARKVSLYNSPDHAQNHAYPHMHNTG